jgi:hypothetical protein
MRYSDHAKQRMQQYGISEAEVEGIISRHQRGEWKPSERDITEHFDFAADGRAFNVVTNRAESIVVTVVPE